MSHDNIGANWMKGVLELSVLCSQLFYKSEIISNAKFNL